MRNRRCPELPQASTRCPSCCSQPNKEASSKVYIQIGITVKATRGSHPLDTQGGEKVKGESFRAGGAEGEARKPMRRDVGGTALVKPVPFEVLYATSKQLESNIDVETQFKKMFVPECPLLAVAGLDLDLQVFEILNHLLMT